MTPLVATRTAFVFKEGFADLVEHGVDGLVQHAVAQELIVAYFQQGDIGLIVFIGCDDDGAFPIYEGEFPGGVVRA